MTSPTSITTQLGTARITLHNDLDVPVRVGVGDETSNEWVLAPGASAGPWDLVTSNVHGDGASVIRTDSAHVLPVTLSAALRYMQPRNEEARALNAIVGSVEFPF